ncbi:MAG TPA: NAD(P)-binding protein [Nitrospirota bacterium]|nr:NAD(P)-binding protein [Nitrospirota bacterium]
MNCRTRKAAQTEWRKEMALVVKKKKRDYGAQASGQQTSALRPKYQPKAPPCTYKCPSSVDVRGYIMHLSQSEMYGRTFDQSLAEAWYMLTDKNPFPAATGRVCPHPCESECNRASIEGPLNINNIERYMGDYGISNSLPLRKLTEQKRAESVAIVGSGPAGLSCAYQLARRGYGVTVYEAFDKPGGMLRYGIPSYRLPEDVLDAEIKKILDVGVQLKVNTKVGKDVSMDELRKGNKVVFMGIGAHAGKKMGIPGEDAPNVMTGAEFLHRVNVGEKVGIGKKVVVVGGGNSAIDAARVSVRLGADVTLSYRRTRAEMPAIAHEIDSAIEEGVNIEYLTAPVEIVVKDGKAVGLKVQRMELGEPDASGRRSPKPVPGSDFVIEASFVIPSISQEPEWEGLETIKNEKGWISADTAGKTPVEGVYAGGDVVNQLGLVTEAIGLGRIAAEAIDSYIQDKGAQAEEAPLTVVRYQTMYREFFPKKDRQSTKHLPAAEVKGSMTKEPALPFSDEEFKTEVSRCMSCGLCFDCDNCWMYCSDGAVEKKAKDTPRGTHYEFILDKCQGCKKCAEACPCGYIDMV